MPGDDEVRVEVLRRLAEQAMSDGAFRADARVDLLGALTRHGYDLNERELALVLTFRSALEDAGIDLSLTEGITAEQIAFLRER